MNTQMPPPVPTPKQKTQKDKKSRSLGLPILIGVLALAIGGIGGFSAGSQSKEGDIKELSSTIGEKDKRIHELAIKVKLQEGDLEELQAAIDKRELELTKFEEGLIERETALIKEEKEAASNEFYNGIHIVGEDIKPGTYTSKTSGMCYYEWKSSTGSDSRIIDNNIVDSGNARVTLKKGDIFESRGCGTWVRK